MVQGLFGALGPEFLVNLVAHAVMVGKSARAVDRRSSSVSKSHLNHFDAAPNHPMHRRSLSGVTGIPQAAAFAENRGSHDLLAGRQLIGRRHPACQPGQ